ncbi:hypothetical protein ACFX2C_009158 [Malus domestica]
MDVKNSFLHEVLQEEVLQPPPGYNGLKDNMMCKLHKAIYGLKQSSRAWYAKLNSVLENARFVRSNVDSSLFVKTGTNGKLVVLIYIYMDYLIITGDSAVEIEALKRSLHQTFAIKYLGRLKYFLGIEMATSSNGLFLHQRKYVLDLLQEANMLDCKHAITHVDCKLRLNIEGEAMHDVSYYQRLGKESSFATISPRPLVATRMKIRQGMHLIENLPQGIVHLWVETLSLGKARSSRSLLALAQRLNIEPWQPLLVNLFGLKGSFQT